MNSNSRFDNFSHFVYSQIPISSAEGIFTPMQPEDHSGSVNLYYIFCIENMEIRNQCRPRSDINRLVWFYLFGGLVSLISQPHSILYGKHGNQANQPV